MPRQPYKMLAKAPIHYKKKSQTVSRGRTRGRRQGTPFLMPVLFKNRMRWAIPEVTLVSTAGSIAEHFYRANSIYRPDLTGATTTAVSGFDQLMNIYDVYQVIGARIVVTFNIPDAEDTRKPMNIWCGCNGGSTGFVSYKQMKENRDTKSKIISPERGATTIVKSFSVPRWFGRRRGAYLNDDELKGTKTTNPSADGQVFFQVGTQALNAQSQGVIINGYIDFITYFSEPNQPPGSAA